MTVSKPVTIMALDVGGRRIGVALASQAARLAQPFTTLENSPEVFKTISELVKAQNAGEIVIGRPRNLSGQVTAQTKIVEDFAAGLKHSVEVPIHWQDEAVTSKQAEAELKAKGKDYAKGDIDSLAATYILEDYLRQTEASHV